LDASGSVRYFAAISLNGGPIFFTLTSWQRTQSYSSLPPLVAAEWSAADDPAAVVDFGAPFVVTVADGLFVVSTRNVSSDSPTAVQPGYPR
jgi:hypothetical protein